MTDADAEFTLDQRAWGFAEPADAVVASVTVEELAAGRSRPDVVVADLSPTP